MARKDRKAHKEDRIDRARKRIWGAHRRLERSLFGPLLGNVHLQWCEGKEGDPLLACVDPGQGVIWVNPHRRPELDEAEWTFILGHELVHLGLNHGPRRQERDPMLWNLACDHAADNFLHAFKLGRPPHDFPVDTTLAGKREEEIYEFLAGERQCRTELKTLAGPGCLDIVRRPCVLSRYGVDRRRRDYEKLLAEGIRRAVDDAVV